MWEFARIETNIKYGSIQTLSRVYILVTLLVVGFQFSRRPLFHECGGYSASHFSPVISHFLTVINISVGRVGSPEECGKGPMGRGSLEKWRFGQFSKKAKRVKKGQNCYFSSNWNGTFLKCRSRKMIIRICCQIWASSYPFLGIRVQSWEKGQL